MPDLANFLAMTFPETRLTFIHRLAASNSESDWREFMTDYWRPICNFARRRCRLRLQDAEEVASQTFEALICNSLLVRWVANRSAKLRSLLCGVILNAVANRARIETGRARLLQNHLGIDEDHNGCRTIRDLDVSAEAMDVFYTVWVEELLDRSVEAILAHYHRSGKGDYFRVLYGKLCEGMTAQEIATALNLRITAVENYYKNACLRLTTELEIQVRQHVVRYSLGENVEGEFRTEWGQLGAYLQDHGGLENVVRRAYEDHELTESRQQLDASRTAAIQRCTELLHNPRPEE